MLVVRCAKRYADFRLEIDLRLDGRSTCVFGPSGCGKSTLVKMVTGLVRPDDGEIVLNDDVLFSRSGRVDLAPPERGIAYVPQDILLFPHLTVKGNLLYGWRRRRAHGPGISTDDVIGLFGLGDLLRKKPTELSGGEAQRVALGRALLSSPQLLILDEPLSSLDGALKEKILGYLRDVLARFDVRILYVTHSTFEIFQVADDVVLMEPGRVIAQGPPDQVFDDPGAFAAIADEGITNVFEGVAKPSPRDRHLVIDCGDFSLDVGPRGELVEGKPVRAHLNSRTIMLSAERPVGLSAQNILPARVNRVVRTGYYALVHLDAGREFVVEITPHALAELALEPGMEVFWIVKSHSIHVEPAPSARNMT